MKNKRLILLPMFLFYSPAGALAMDFPVSVLSAFNSASYFFGDEPYPSFDFLCALHDTGRICANSFIEKLDRAIANYVSESDIDEKNELLGVMGGLVIENYENTEGIIPYLETIVEEQESNPEKAEIARKLLELTARPKKPSIRLKLV